MFQTKTILTTLAFGSLALCSAALADTLPPITGPISPTVSPTSSPIEGSPVTSSDEKRDDVKFECHFRCDEDNKGDSHEECRAKGQLDARKLHDNDWIFGDNDDFLRIRCDRDNDDHGRDDERKGIIYGRHFDDLLIMGDKTTSPLIVVERADDLRGERKATLILRHDDRKIEGECRFERRHDDDSISPSPMPSPISSPSVRLN